MIVEFLFHLINLDIAWIINAIFNNIFWFFAVFMASYFLFSKKKTLFGMGVIFFAVLGVSDFSKFIGWVYLTPVFLMIYYVIQFAFLAAFENTKALKNQIVLCEEALFFGSLIFFNLFIR